MLLSNGIQLVKTILTFHKMDSPASIERRKEFIKTAMGFLAIFKDGVALHTLNNWVMDHFEAYLQENKHLVSLGSVISYDLKEVIISSRLSINPVFDESFDQVFPIAYRISKLYDLESTCDKALTEFQEVQRTIEAYKNWYEKYKEIGSYIHVYFIIECEYNEEDEDPYFYLLNSPEKGVIKIKKSDLATQMLFFKCYLGVSELFEAY